MKQPLSLVNAPLLSWTDLLKSRPPAADTDLMRRQDIHLQQLYKAERQLRDFPRISCVPYKPWQVEVLETGLDYETRTRYEWNGTKHVTVPVIKPVGVRVRDTETDIEYLLQTRHIISTWADFELKSADRDTYDVERAAHRAACDERAADIHLSILGALQKGGVDLSSCGEELTQELSRPTTWQYTFTPEAMLELLRSLGLTNATPEPKPEAPLSPGQKARLAPPQEYKTEAARDRQMDRFMTALRVIKSLQDERDELNAEGLKGADGEPLSIGSIPDYQDGGEDENGNERRHLKLGLSKWISATQIGWRMEDELGLSEAATKRLLTEMGRRDLVWSTGGGGAGGGGWRVSTDGEAMLAAAMSIPDALPG